MKNIISASRRTDIPAFHLDRFFRALQKGSYDFIAPYNSKPAVVSLTKDDVLCFVFWSKDYGPFTERLDEFDSYGMPAYFHHTITGYPKIYEKQPAGRKICRTCSDTR